MTETEFQQALLQMERRLSKIEEEMKGLIKAFAPMIEAQKKTAVMLAKGLKQQEAVKEKLAKAEAKKKEKVDKVELSRLIEEKIEYLGKQLAKHYEPLDFVDLSNPEDRARIVNRKEMNNFIMDKLYDEFCFQNMGDRGCVKVIRAAGIDPRERFVRFDTGGGIWRAFQFMNARRIEN
jgi:hypothetical protein